LNETSLNWICISRSKDDRNVRRRGLGSQGCGNASHSGEKIKLVARELGGKHR
jgi:hypothetical protein